MRRKLLLLSTICLMSTSAFAQNHQTIIDQYLNENSQLLNQNSLQYQILESIHNAKNNSDRVIVQYEYNGIPIYNAYGNFGIKNNKVFHFASNENEIELSKSFAQAKSNISDQDLLSKIGTSLGLSTYSIKADQPLTKTGVFLVDNYEVKPYYFLHNDSYRLVKEFMVSVKTEKDNDVYFVLIDSNNGEVLHQHSATLSCDFHPETFSNPSSKETDAEYAWLYEQYKADASNPQYRIYKLPLEAPNDGASSLVDYLGVTNETASPEGWHQYGTEPVSPSTYGNNVRASHDHKSVGFNSFGYTSVTLDGEVFGTDDYVFDYALNPNTHPFNYKEAATTNLFYMNNMMHDIYYNYGFDEASGNFQKKNFGKGGSENDEVIALAQTRFNEGVLNNATFATLPDGYLNRMSMFLWNAPTSFVGKAVTISSPSDIVGDYVGVAAGFGSAIEEDIPGKFVLAKKESTAGALYDACDTLNNASELNNNIAIITRGSCDFVVKVKNAQNAGAKGVIMVNNIAGSPSAMGGTDATITIPSVMVSQADGNLVINKLSAGTDVQGKLNAVDIPYYDGSFDNGIIAHEYGHGISNRLTGPRTNASCLQNLEQMGEGWSDFFGLMITMKPGDTRDKARGIGTYVQDAAITGPGIRPTRYSTNMTVNPANYGNLRSYGNSDSPHRTGYVWASMLWDMTWNLIDKYGFSPDIYNGTGGNNLAIQLVMDGLKLQPCSPGFVDGRNAILAADEANNEGANQCEIWSAFAKRGLGYSADQGSTNSRTDGTAAYDMPPVEVLNCELATANVSKSDLQIFPNPAKEAVYISDKSLSGDVKVEIIDVAGRVLSSQNLKVTSNRTTVNTSSLTAGVYILKINTGKDVVTKKLIIK